MLRHWKTGLDWMSYWDVCFISYFVILTAFWPLQNCDELCHCKCCHRLFLMFFRIWRHWRQSESFTQAKLVQAGCKTDLFVVCSRFAFQKVSWTVGSSRISLSDLSVWIWFNLEIHSLIRIRTFYLPWLMFHHEFIMILVWCFSLSLCLTEFNSILRPSPTEGLGSQLTNDCEEAGPLRRPEFVFLGLKTNGDELWPMQNETHSSQRLEPALQQDYNIVNIMLQTQFFNLEIYRTLGILQAVQFASILGPNFFDGIISHTPCTLWARARYEAGTFSAKARLAKWSPLPKCRNVKNV